MNKFNKSLTADGQQTSMGTSHRYYPKGVSSKLVVEQVLRSLHPKDRQAESETSSLSSKTTNESDIHPTADDQCRTYNLPDGSKLVITKKSNNCGLIYVLHAADERKVILETVENSIGMTVTDSQGNTIRTLGCDL